MKKELLLSSLLLASSISLAAKATESKVSNDSEKIETNENIAQKITANNVIFSAFADTCTGTQCMN